MIIHLKILEQIGVVYKNVLHRPKRKMRQKYNKDNILNLI